MISLLLLVIGSGQTMTLMVSIVEICGLSWSSGMYFLKLE